MDNLENFIKENRQELDIKTPSDQVWAKIAEQRQQDVQTQSKVVPMYGIYKIMRVAASVIILALAAFGIYNLVPQTKDVDMAATTAPLPMEVVEMDQYYEQQVATQVVAVEQLLEDPELLADIKSDLELLNKEKNQLMGEFSQEIDNQELMEALAATYRMKLQVLENILEMIKEDNHEDQKSI